MENARLIACNSNPELAKAISEKLKIPIVNKSTRYFSNDESRVTIDSTVRGLDIYIVATGVSRDGKSINDHVMELYFMVCTCKRSGANSITVLLPLYPYARQDKKDHPRAGIMAKDVADLLHNAGMNRIVCLDLHNGAIQGFFNEPCDNLYGSLILKPFLNEHFFKDDPQYREHYVAVSPDEGGVKRTSHYAKLFGLQFISMDKTRDYSKENVVENLSYVAMRTALRTKPC